MRYYNKRDKSCAGSGLEYIYGRDATTHQLWSCLVRMDIGATSTRTSIYILLLLLLLQYLMSSIVEKLLWTKRAQEKVDRQRGATRFYSIVVATPAADGGRDSGVLR